MGLECSWDDDRFVVAPSSLTAARRITTGLWPGFPSDMVSLVTVLATQAEGETLVHDWMYELRLFALEQLSAMRADLFLCDPHRIIVSGIHEAEGPSARHPGHSIRDGPDRGRACRRGGEPGRPARNRGARLRVRSSNVSPRSARTSSAWPDLPISARLLRGRHRNSRARHLRQTRKRRLQRLRECRGGRRSRASHHRPSQWPGRGAAAEYRDARLVSRRPRAALALGGTAGGPLQSGRACGRCAASA